MTGARVVAIVLVVVTVLVVGTLFVLQNGARETQLSLDLGFRAWELRRPVTVPALIAVSFAAGLLVAAVPLGLRSLRLQSKLRRLSVREPAERTPPGDVSPDAW